MRLQFHAENAMPTIQDEFLLTTEDYHRMIDAGILTEDDRVELIDGKITPVAAVGGAPIYTVNQLTELFVKHVGPDMPHTEKKIPVGAFLP